jgi:hypothetical protein
MAVLRLNTQHVLIWHGSFVAMIVVFAAGTHLLGLHTPELARLPPALGGLMLSMTISWLVLTSRMFTTTWKHLFEKIFLLASTTLLMLVPAAGVLFHESVLSPTGLVVSCAINLILWMGYAGALHRHYRSKDLNAHQVGLDYQVT